MPVRRGTLSALPTLDSCPHLELLAQLLTRALLTTAPEACLEVVPLTSNQLDTKAQASGHCQPLSTAQASSNSEAALLLFGINLPSLTFRESPVMSAFTWALANPLLESLVYWRQLSPDAPPPPPHTHRETWPFLILLPSPQHWGRLPKKERSQKMRPFSNSAALADSDAGTGQAWERQKQDSTGVS